MHENLDPMTGNCLDCGATREALDDNIYPTCEKFTGPHKLALIVIHCERIRQEFSRDNARRGKEESEKMVAYWQQVERLHDANVRELAGSLDLLKEASGCNNQGLSLGEAISRTRDNLR